MTTQAGYMHHPSTWPMQLSTLSTLVWYTGSSFLQASDAFAVYNHKLQQPHKIPLITLLPVHCRVSLSLMKLNPYAPTRLHKSSVRPSAAHSLQAFLAALLFAAHPIHTEAVAGIVGHAELLSAALALLALMAYMAAAAAPSATQHYKLLLASICTLCLAALAKEIGITMVNYSLTVRLTVPLADMVPQQAIML